MGKAMRAGVAEGWEAMGAVIGATHGKVEGGGRKKRVSWGG